jgi:hypothetical protein
MSDFVPWLRELADKGGSGVVNNVDARSLGRIADLIVDMRVALEEMVRWMPSKFAPQSQSKAMNMAEAAIRKARGVS